jgi:hypothetical protein
MAPSRLRPSLDDIRFRFALLSDDRIDLLTDAEYRSFMSLVRFCASGQVWTYSAPGDGGLPVDDRSLARLAKATPRIWARGKANVLALFERRGDRYYLAIDLIEITEGNERPALSAVLRMKIMQRDAWTCGYCGTTTGPFDVDHIVPLIQGGSNTLEDNLICACAKCNRAKGGRTPAQWISGQESED